MLLIYTPHTSNRLRYVLNHIFKQQLGIPYAITNEYAIYQHEKIASKFIYDDQNKGHGVFFYASTLLKETKIHKFPLSEGQFGDIPVLFSHNHQDSALNFDVFAAVFYLLSRYEEYVYKGKDPFGNFDFRQSVLYRLKILETPIVEQWIDLLKQCLHQHFPGLIFQEKKHRYALSFDIDVAFAYRNKHAVITSASLLKKFTTFRWRDLADQLLTLSGIRKDCYDTYDYIFEKIVDHAALFFINIGRYDRFDKNPSYKNKNFKTLIRKIISQYPLGLHPSYASNKNPALLFTEKKKLEYITGQKTKISRQHYLKLNMPDTYQHLIQMGITKDFTMGYYFCYGFRAGTCNPFFFFDLKKDEASALQIFPFAVMDGTLNNVLECTPEDAQKRIKDLLETVRKWKGIFIPIWHNSTLSETREWKNWRPVFEYMIRQIKQEGFEPEELDFHKKTD